jgi:hypothetical protein
VHLVPDEPERVDNRVRERGTQERVSIIPAALMERESLHGHRRQIVAKPKPLQDTGRVRGHLDARTDLADRTRLLVHVHIEPGLVERERGSEAADPATDDPHREHITHVTNDTPRAASLTAGEVMAPCASVLLLDGPTQPRAGLPRPSSERCKAARSGCSGTVLPPGSGDRSEKSPGIGATPSAAKPGRRPIPRLYREDAEERRNLRVSREVPSNG